MATFYQDMQAVASDLLRKFDQGDVYYIAAVKGAGPADAPGEPVETTYKVDAAARGVSFKYIDGSNIVASDLQATMAVHSDFTPAIGGFVIVGARRYKVVRVVAKPAAGTPVAYTVIFRA